MATFVCREYPTLTQHVPSLGRNVQFASGQYTARDEDEAEALRALVEAGYLPAYETDEESDRANAVLAEKARKASERAAKKVREETARPARVDPRHGQGQPGQVGDDDRDEDEDED